MTDYSGLQLGHYHLERLLGQGSFAQVYLATHLHLGTQAAIKILNQVANQEAIEQFRREARTIAALVHPHIVRVLDFGLHEGHLPYLVMDYLPGGSLRQRHPAGCRLPLLVALDYTRQIAEALHYAHEARFVHRDVKPENMLVGRDGGVLLADFGIATIASSTRLQSTRDLAGTVTYMAPEQIQGYPRPESDQYALAVVLYEWLVGAPPFAGSFNEIAAQHCMAPVPSLRQYVPEIPPDIEVAIQRALAKDWRARFSSVKEFATALEETTIETMRGSAIDRFLSSPASLMASGIIPTESVPLRLPPPTSLQQETTPYLLPPGHLSSPSPASRPTPSHGRGKSEARLSRDSRTPRQARRPSRSAAMMVPSPASAASWVPRSLPPPPFPLNYLPLTRGKATLRQVVGMLLYVLLALDLTLPLFLLAYLSPSTTRTAPAWAVITLVAMLLLLPAIPTLAGKIFGSWRGALVSSLLAAALWGLNSLLLANRFFPSTWQSAVALAGGPLASVFTGWLARRSHFRSFGQAWRSHFGGLLIMLATLTIGLFSSPSFTQPSSQSSQLAEAYLSLYCCIFPIWLLLTATCGMLLEMLLQKLTELLQSRLRRDQPG
ncbi:serine/threonine-protein kinase [Thermogemmatispora carboxidivorans]|uniref:serine/threonine-protein kinase n=1 Tax=Thermogemmatispora carboxidivorans TaxID=1382306 RepID=UPI00069A11CE|nr:serine/threonine-protein kinase [Thermogemmatispora carboxidivorans]